MGVFCFSVRAWCAHESIFAPHPALPHAVRGEGDSARAPGWRLPMRRAAKPEIIELRGRDVSLRVRKSRRARHVSLRIDEKRGGVDLILPRAVTRDDGMTFVHHKAAWILREIDALPPRVPFADGAVLPLLGTDYRIRHRPDARGTVWVEDGSINVAGRAPHVQRRVADWLKRRARQEIARRAAAAARKIDKRVNRLSLRDTRSRWGSCSEEGHLSFSWRLILAPEAVLDYVIAHEVAHLEELNHSPRFWRLVSALCPDNKVPRHWLKRNGASLHRYG